MRWPWQLWKDIVVDDEGAEKRVREAEAALERAERLRAAAAPIIETARQQRRENGFAKAIEETMRGRPWRDRPA